MVFPPASGTARKIPLTPFEVRVLFRIWFAEEFPSRRIPPVSWPLIMFSKIVFPEEFESLMATPWVPDPGKKLE